MNYATKIVVDQPCNVVRANRGRNSALPSVLGRALGYTDMQLAFAAEAFNRFAWRDVTAPEKNTDLRREKPAKTGPGRAA